MNIAYECAFFQLFCPQNYVPKVKTGHVVPGVKLERLKQRLSQVKGALVEAPLVRLCFFLSFYLPTFAP